jgi:hypothetical protein
MYGLVAMISFGEDGIIATREVCDHSACFFHEKDSSGHIPRREAVFVETIKPAARHIRQVGGSRTRPANAMRMLHQMLEELEVLMEQW